MKYILIAFLLIGSAKAQDSTGNFTIKAPIQVWQQLLDALDKSTASHLLITDLNKFIVDQINAQVKKPEVKKEPVKKEGAKQ